MCSKLQMTTFGGKGKRRPWWCIVCGSDEDDELKYGQLCQTRNFNVHFLCLLFSSTFEQHGRDHEGVFGFRIKDIELGLDLIRDSKCWYCGLGNASIYCAKKKCRRVFHLTCARESGCLTQFLGQFESYCHRHNDEFKYHFYRDETCVICTERLKFTCDAVQNDCCNSVFHRRCLGSLALSSGYFFKCPLCNNTEQFRKCMRQKGIYVPDRDAAWELENNAFHELHAPTYSCEATKCLSKHGREYNSVQDFAFMSCGSCGAASIHRKCCTSPEFTCQMCTKLFRAPQEESTLSDSIIQKMIEDSEKAEAADNQNTPPPVSKRLLRSAQPRRPESPEKMSSPFKRPQQQERNVRLKKRRIL